MSITVTSSLGDLAADLRTIATESTSTMARVLAKNARQGRNLARDFARVSAGAHGTHYPTAITTERRSALSWEYGPDSAMPQGGMSFEYGSRNQKPHLDLNKSADIVGPALAFEVGKAVGDLFWPGA